MKLLKSLKQFAIAVLMVALTGPVFAENAFLELREEHWLEAMNIGRVDSELLYAIALQESGTSFDGMREYGPWPWVMNITELDCEEEECKEVPKFFSSREAARKVLEAEVKKGNEQIAVGMWQIHLRYNAHYVVDPLDLVDPVTNLYVAAMVLRGCGEKYDTTRHVLSCYYSGDVDEKGMNYAEGVLALARKWGQPLRFRTAPRQVRFSHDSSTPRRRAMATRLHADTVEGPATENSSLIDQTARSEPAQETDRAGQMEPTISLSMLAATKKPLVTQSHAEFLAAIGDKAAVWTQRVIVVD